MSGDHNHYIGLKPAPKPLAIKTYGMFSATGLVYCGLHASEDSVWQTFFGYPDDEEIEGRKQEGYCVREVCVFWRNPQSLASAIKYAIWQAITDLESHCRHRTAGQHQDWLQIESEDRASSPVIERALKCLQDCGVEIVRDPNYPNIRIVYDRASNENFGRA